jgi:hypothetical protein
VGGLPLASARRRTPNASAGSRLAPANLAHITEGRVLLDVTKFRDTRIDEKRPFPVAVRTGDAIHQRTPFTIFSPGRLLIHNIWESYVHFLAAEISSKQIKYT